MSDENAMSRPPQAQKDMPVHCAKCGAFNERTADACTDCGSHLRLKCRKCQSSNLRTASRCSKCHQLLRTGGAGFGLFNLKLKGRLWRRGWLRRRIRRWNRPAALVLTGALILWALIWVWIGNPSNPVRR
ncbi:MAG: hypothetical protein ABMA26_25860 [Limisphaerales bacterium]